MSHRRAGDRLGQPSHGLGCDHDWQHSSCAVAVAAQTDLTGGDLLERSPRLRGMDFSPETMNEAGGYLDRRLFRPEWSDIRLDRMKRNVSTLTTSHHLLRRHRTGGGGTGNHWAHRRVVKCVHSTLPGPAPSTARPPSRSPESGWSDGIGLAPARRLIETEGGQLRRAHPGPCPRFEIVLTI